jgi:hypothetical protein
MKLAVASVESLNSRQPTRQEAVMLRARHPTQVAPFALVAVAILVLSGCAPTPERGGQRAPAPELQMVTSGPLAIPANCDVSAGTVYRTSFVVQTDGRVSEARTDPAPECLQRALVAWVESVKYAAPGRAVPASVDWMLVSASRLH